MNINFIFFHVPIIFSIKKPYCSKHRKHPTYDQHIAHPFNKKFDDSLYNGINIFNPTNTSNQIPKKRKKSRIYYLSFFIPIFIGKDPFNM